MAFRSFTRDSASQYDRSCSLTLSNPPLITKVAHIEFDDPSGSFDDILMHQKSNMEGLNPVMFILALIGNATYVGSIVVNSLDWSRIRPNLPWLVDAGGCVLLDAFILLQFLYFHLQKPIDAESRNDHFNFQ